MAKRILVPVERTREMEFALRVVRMIARESGGVVRLLAVIPIPKAVCDNRDRVVVTTDQQMDRLASAAADDLSRMAALALDGVPVETSVIFGTARGGAVLAPTEPGRLDPPACPPVVRRTIEHRVRRLERRCATRRGEGLTLARSSAS